MGKRHEALRFLPGVMVFPGGRVERGDIVPPISLDQSSVLELAFEHPKGPSPDTLAATALRECLEETGLDAAEHIDGSIRYVARAVTPPHVPVRYDTHFLAANVHNSRKPPEPKLSGDGELIEPAWYTHAQLAEQKLHHVTRHVLDFCFSHNNTADIPTSERILVADRRPKRWRGQKPARSRDLRDAAVRKS